MTFEQELTRLADGYTNQGYEVTLRPGRELLPVFAKDFQIEIVCRRGSGGVLVSAKKNRQEMAADKNVARYAEIINHQPGWRFDFAILEEEDPWMWEMRGAQELPDEGITKALDEADQLLHSGFIRPAILAAWAGFEAAMRRRMRALGEVEKGTVPRQLLNELYAAGILSISEFSKLENAYRLRNEIVHGFASPNLNAEVVPLLIDTTRQLLEESQLAHQPV